MKQCLWFYLFFMSFLPPLFAKTIEGVDLAQSVELEGEALVLNGAGMRKKSIFISSVNVYVGALYLKEKKTTWEAIKSSSYPRQIIMHFVRDVGGSRLLEGFREGLQKQWKVRAELEKELMEGFDKISKSLQDLKEGEKIILSFFPKKVVMTIANKEPISIEVGENFPEALLGVWFIDPEDKKLKDALLGGVEEV